MGKSLEGKVAVITGAASGMGRASAVRFAREGARLALADIAEDKLEETRGLVEDVGGDVLAMRTDLSDLSQVDAFVDATAERFDHIDVVYNNAGTIAGGRIEDYTEAQWDLLHAVNSKAQFFLVQRALPYIERAGSGSIINCSSMSGMLGMDGQAVYCASKGSSVALTRALAYDLAPRNIRVNCICPGAVDTPMPGAFLAHFPAEEHQGLREGWVARQLIKRMGEPDEVASVALFLASDESSFLTGLVLPVDGGWAAW